MIVPENVLGRKRPREGVELSPLAALAEMHVGDANLIFYRQSQDSGRLVRCKPKAYAAPDELPLLLPMLPALDCYASLNTFKGRTNKSVLLASLDACFADLDCYQMGVTTGTVLGLIWDMVQARKLPEPSVYVLSGRGAWVLFLLKTKSGEVVPATVPNLEAWRTIQTWLGHTLADMGADANARDVSRICRVPGSTNAKSGEQVRYLFSKARYTLADLAAWVPPESPVLRAKQTARAVHQKAAPPPAPSAPPARRLHMHERMELTPSERGFQTLYRERLAALQTLENSRGGFSEGQRFAACHLLSHFLRRLGNTDGAILESVADLASRCEPPLPQAEVAHAIETAAFPKITNRTIIERLHITPAELDTMNLGSAKAKPQSPPGERAQRREERRALLREYLRDFPKATLRQLAAWLLAQHSIKAAKDTLRADRLAITTEPPTQEYFDTQDAN